MKDKTPILILAIILATILFILSISSVSAITTPTYVSYQGKLANATNGNPFTTASLNISIWNNSALSQLAWNRTFNDLTDSQGVFDLVLGRYTPLYLEPGRNYYMKVEVDLNSATFIAADETFGDDPDNGDIILVGAGGAKNASELLIGDGTGNTVATVYVRNSGDNITGNLNITGDVNITGMLNVSTNFSVSALANCDVVATDANGYLVCDNDATGSAFVNNSDISVNYINVSTINLSGTTITSWGDINQSWYYPNATVDALITGNSSVINNSDYVNFSKMTLGDAIMADGFGSLNLSGNLTVVRDFKIYSPGLGITEMDEAGSGLKIKAYQWIELYFNEIGQVGKDFKIINENGVGADTYAFVINSSNDYIGIGTANPVARLDVQGELNVSSWVNASSFCFGDGTCIDDWGDVNVSGSGGGPGNVNGTGNTGYIAMWNDTEEINDSIIFQDSDGQIGIGITTPINALDVIGDINASGDLQASGGDIISWGVGSELILRDDSAINQLIRLQHGATNGFQFAMGGGGSYEVLGLWNNNSFGIQTNMTIGVGNNDLFVDITSSRVGIGTSSPTHKLNVLGSGNLINISNSTDTIFNIDGDTGRIGIGSKGGNALLDMVQGSKSTIPYIRIYEASDASAANKNVISATLNANSGTKYIYFWNHFYGEVFSIGNTGNGSFADDITLLDGRIDGGDTLVRLYDSSDDGIIDVYQNNVVVSRISGVSGADNYINNGGKVGIGTATPSQALTVAGNINASGIINGTTVSTTNLYDNDGSNFFDLSSCGADTALSTIDATGAVACVPNTAVADGTGPWATGSGTIYNSTSGLKVGIGTTTPSQALHVVDNTYISGNVTIGGSLNDKITSYGGYIGNATANIGGTGDAAYFPEGIYSAKQNWLYGGISMSNGNLIDAGDLDFNDEITPDGAVCSNGQILKKTGTDDWDCAADGGSVWTAGSGTIYNSTSGLKVGIGTASPTQALHVVGNANITGNIYTDGNEQDDIGTNINAYNDLWTQNVKITDGTANGIYFWNGATTYSITMGNDQTDHGTVTDYSMHFDMGTTVGRGFTFGSTATSPSLSINALTGTLTTNGNIKASGNVTIGGSLNVGNATTPMYKFEVAGSKGIFTFNPDNDRMFINTTASRNLTLTSSSGNVVIQLG